jgi:hypothetical protein
MACTFTIAIEGSTTTFVAKAKEKVEQNGGSFEANGNKGTFFVALPLGQQISGNYALNQQDMIVNITHKPIVIGCGKIEEYVKTHIQ